MKKFVKRILFPYNYLKLNILNFYLNKINSKKKFDFIYKTNYWKSSLKGSRSGRGSDIDTTENIRFNLKNFIINENIKSILDIPCGDFYWMSKIDLKEVTYIGADIVEELVNLNNIKFKNSKLKFIKLDITKDNMPDVDLIFSRDCLVHLNDDEIFLTLQNIKKTKSKYFATTIFEKKFNNSKSELSDNWRAINLTEKPFDLKKPDFILDESNNDQSDKKIAIWKIKNF